MIWYRIQGESNWKVVPHGSDLPSFAHSKLEDLAYRDSDNGYREVIEFHDGLLGIRTYGCAAYACYYEDSGGGIEEFIYGDIEQVRQAFGKTAVSPYPYAPDRDWILVGKYQYA